MSSIYCGAKKPPKGKKYGSMSQCKERNQIRLYGLRKVDPLIAQHKPVKKVSKFELMQVKKEELKRLMNCSNMISLRMIHH